MVSKTVKTKMLQTVWNNDISFGKVFAHDQLSYLVTNNFNLVAMVTSSKNPKWQPSAQVSDFVIFLKIKLSKTTKIITNMNF